MKKLLVIFIFLLGFMFMPIVNAEEIPREGVTYFLEYPDGTEDVKEDYDEAIAAAEEEKLIFTGQTDENGQVVLENIGSEGTLRVVQEVPNGYSTDEREVIINLEEGKKVDFKITKGLINPKTGFSILKILLILAVVITCTILTKKKKKLLLVLPLLLLAGLVNVKADNDNLVIDVKDNLGRGQSGVTVKVYAKPILDPAPAIVYNANGGLFADGSEKLYTRLPHNNCTRDEYQDYLESDADYYTIITLIYTVFKEGYVINSFSQEETFSNGDEIIIGWEPVQSGIKKVTVHGNGGKTTYKGKEITEVYFYDNNSITLLFPFFMLNENPYKKVGVSSNSSCTSFLSREEQQGGNIPTDVYYCWEEKPDGIYINDVIFVGTTNNCFNYGSLNQTTFDDDDNNMVLITIDYVPRTLIISQSMISISNLNSNQPVFSNLVKYTSALLSSGEENAEPVTKIEIVKNGQTIFSATDNDIIEVQQGTPSRSNDTVYTISNEQKLNQLLEIFGELYTNGCIEGITQEDRAISNNQSIGNIQLTPFENDFSLNKGLLFN